MNPPLFALGLVPTVGSPSEVLDCAAIAIPRLVWGGGGTDAEQRVAYTGRQYQLRDALPGPTPAHAIPIWVGAYRPRLLEVTGRLADGWTISHEQFPPQSLPERNAT